MGIWCPAGTPPSLRNASWSCSWSSSMSGSPPKKGDGGPPPLAGLMSSSPRPTISSPAPLLMLLFLENTGGGAHEEGEDTESGEGAVPQRPEFCRESMKGEWAAAAAAATEVGVPGPDAGRRPSSFLALAMTVWSSASGPKARRIISFSPWSWMRRKPMILAAWSGSSAWIRENTTLVAS
ncbi:Os07g0682500 [Oryza sativa Japonica Group]|uniref:Os07g0682500 protein n=1 Tax=Oryza sativa subsp. japonica TaxID=39947 RepID=A0A0P0XAP8_ORYSJ|nr:hypothetical protein EE612_041429 [Oryza sativa]BAT03256.1 Os07g0682500 [Oryza sativa Japonica Group]